MSDASRAILERRARALARPLAADEDADFEALDLLLFGVGDERLAISIGMVVAIARAGRIAPLPRATAPVYGVTAWRGRPLTVLSLAAGRLATTADMRLLVLGTGSRAGLALAVDTVDDVVRVPAAAMTPAPPGPRATYTLGVMSDGLLVIDGDALLYPATLSR